MLLLFYTIIFLILVKSASLPSTPAIRVWIPLKPTACLKRTKINKKRPVGRGDGQVASVLALWSDDPSSNPTDTYSFSIKILFEKNEEKQIEAGVGLLKKLW